MEKQSKNSEIKSSRDSPASLFSEKELAQKEAQYRARLNRAGSETGSYGGSAYRREDDFSEEEQQEHAYLKSSRLSRLAESEKGTDTAGEKLSARKSSFSEKNRRSDGANGSTSGKTKTMASRSRLRYEDSEKAMSKNEPVSGRNRIKKAAKAAAAGASQIHGHDEEDENSQEDVQDALNGELYQSVTAAKRGSRQILLASMRRAKGRREEAENESDEPYIAEDSAAASDRSTDAGERARDANRDGSRRAEEKKEERTAREKAKNGYLDEKKQASDQKSAYLQERRSKFSDGSPQADLIAESGQDGAASKEASKKSQKRKIKQQYAQAVANRERDAFAGGAAGSGSVTATGAATAAEGSASAEAASAGAGTLASAAFPVILVIVIIFLILFCIFLFTFLSFGTISGTTTATTYKASNNDMLDMNNQYEKLEEELQQEIKRTPDDYPDYDEYEYELDEITHNGNVLASYFTALKGDFQSGDISEELKDLFSRQYEIVREERTETRTRTEPQTTFDDQGNATTTYVEVEYQAKILKTKLINHNLSEICQEKLGSDLSQRYLLYLEATGNRPELFGGEVSPDDLYAYYYKDGKIDMNVDDLPDTLVGKMLSIAHDQEKKPYVYGAAHGADYYSDNPSAFDCSSFVSWVIKNSIGKDDFACRDTNGLKSVCDDVSTADAQPGDLIFFKNTYNFPGISHVGIYIGDGQMIHAGNPVKVSKIDTQYWQSHFVGFGRLKAEYQR